MGDEQVILQYLKTCDKIRPKILSSNVQIQNYLDYQALKIRESRKTRPLICGASQADSMQVSDGFKHAFSNLSALQKAQFYQKNCLFVQKCLRGDAAKMLSDLGLEQSQTRQVLVREGLLFNSWTKYSAKIDKKLRTIQIPGAKQSVDLHMYILRKSKGIKKCLVLEPIEDLNVNKIVRIAASKDSEFQDLYQLISKVNGDAILQNLYKEIFIAKSGNFQPSLSIQNQLRGLGNSQLVNKRSGLDQSGSNKDLTFLKLQNINRQDVSHTDFNDKSSSRNLDHLVTFRFMNDLQDFGNYDQVSKGIFFAKTGNKVRRIFFVRGMQIKVQQLIHEFLTASKLHQWKPTLKTFSKLNQDQRANTKTKKHQFYELHFYPDQKIQIGYIYLRQVCIKGGNYYVVDQQINDPVKGTKLVKKGNINSVIWQIRRKNQNSIEVIVEADIDHQSNADNRELTQAFLGNISRSVRPPPLITYQSLKRSIYLNEIQLKNQTTSKQYRTQDFSKEYLSEISRSGDNQTQYYSIESQLPQSPTFSEAFLFTPMKLTRTNSETFGVSVIGNSLTYRHIFNPLPKLSNKVLVSSSISNHYAWGKHWIIQNNGTLKSIINKINIQSGLLAKQMKLFPINFLQVNFLPIQGFAKESYLQNLCNALAFAPLFLEQIAKKNVVQRFKAVFCFKIGLMILLIRLQKLYKPIIGQTYQALIDGCPVYGEHVSHNPSISTFFMKGRGYFIHGCQQPTIDISLELALRTMESFFTVAFDEEDLHKNKIVFSGTPHFIKKIVDEAQIIRSIGQTIMFDQKQHVYCSINWNPGCVQGQMSNHYNTFYGQLVRLRSDAHFNYYDKKKKPKKDDIVERLGIFHGKWVDKVYFNDELVFDITRQAPCKVEKYEYSLESDSSKRKDWL